ncbi:unnamed protein product [Sphagnum balticum]
MIGYPEAEVSECEYAHEMGEPAEEEEVGECFEAALIDDVSVEAGYVLEDAVEALETAEYGGVLPDFYGFSVFDV